MNENISILTGYANGIFMFAYYIFTEVIPYITMIWFMINTEAETRKRKELIETSFIKDDMK